MGVGEAWYGKSLAALSEEEFQQLREEKMRKKGPDPNAPLKSNAVLIVGNMKSIGQWIAFDLLEKGFTVRVACSDEKEGVAIFGLSGINVDMLPLSSSSDDKAYARALQGTQAIVFCANFEPPSFLKKNAGNEETDIAFKMLQMCTKTRRGGGVCDVKKVVMLSREWPWASELPRSSSNPFASLFGSGQQLDSPALAPFRATHAALEEATRNAGLEYMIVRAPPNVIMSREGARLDLMLLQANEPGKDSAAAKEGRAIAAAAQEGGLSVGVLDLAEASVQALIQDGDIPHTLIHTTHYSHTHTRINIYAPNIFRAQHFPCLQAIRLKTHEKH